MPPPDRFFIKVELCRGAWSSVFLAHDRDTDTDVALKVYREPHGAAARQGLAVSRTLAVHSHPGLAAIHHVDEGRVAMEVIAGGTLKDRWGKAGGMGLQAAETEKLAVELLGALAFIHSLGIVHGDISARNVLLRSPGHPVVVDFVGWLPEHGDPPGGTPAYLAPERWIGEGPSPAGDLFSVGALLWETVTGVRLRTPEILENRGVSDKACLEQGAPAIRRLVTSLIATDPNDRPTAQEALERLGKDHPLIPPTVPRIG